MHLQGRWAKSHESTSGKLVFVIGTGRCGSTLIQELLAHHPDVGFLSNLEDRIPGVSGGTSRATNMLYRRLPPSLTRMGRIRYGPSEGYRALAREVSPLVTNSCRDLRADDAMPWVTERFRTFFCERARAQRRPVFLHKFTGWPRTGFVHEIFPDARFIHIVRDGRAVVASALRMPWWMGHMGPEAWHWGPLPPAYAAEWEASGRSFAVLAALAWKILMDEFAAARELVPGDQWLDIRFEDVLADPKPRLKEMLGFMGLDEHRSVDAALVRAGIVPDRQRYRHELGSAGLAQVEKSLAEHLDAWGYEVPLGSRTGGPGPRVHRS
jgi:Sulfotransferase family